MSFMCSHCDVRVTEMKIVTECRGVLYNGGLAFVYWQLVRVDHYIGDEDVQVKGPENVRELKDIAE